MKQNTGILGFLLVLVAASCGGGDENGSLEVGWTFASGDCSSNGIETVRVKWVAPDGTSQESSFPCGANGGTLGTLEQGNYSFRGEGLDANGVARVESYGSTMSVSGSTGFGQTVTITLHPSASDVVVSWSIQGRPCPASITLPFFITIYEPDTSPREVVAETQESCASGKATLKSVPPGDYIVELDSRAVTPAVKLSAPVTVKPGEPAEVSLD